MPQILAKTIWTHTPTNDFEFGIWRIMKHM